MLTDNLASHPAFLAWKTVEPKARQPHAIEILKESRQEDNGISPDQQRSALKVIAKRCRAGSLDTEIRIYAEILPQLGLSTLAHYGYLEEFDGHSWIFQQDAATSRIHEQTSSIKNSWSIGSRGYTPARQAHCLGCPRRARPTSAQCWTPCARARESAGVTQA